MSDPKLDNPIVWSGILGVTMLLLWVASEVLWLSVPMILTCLLYYLTAPLVDRVKRRGLPHEVAVWLVVFGAVSVVCLGLAAVTMQIDETTASVQDVGMRYLEGGSRAVERGLNWVAARFEPAHSLPARWDRFMKGFEERFAEEMVPELLKEAVAWILPLILVPFVTFFCLKDGSRFKKSVMRVVPNAYFEKTLLLFHRMDQEVKLYFNGMFWWTVVVSTLLGACLWMIGVPHPFLLATVASVLGWVPYLGTVVGCLLIMLVAATDMPTMPHAPWLVLGTFVAVRLFDDIVIIPMTIGRSLDLHPLLTVLSIFLGGEVAGVTGMLLAMPIMGLVRSIADVTLGVLMDTRLRIRHGVSRQRQLERARARFE